MLETIVTNSKKERYPRFLHVLIAFLVLSFQLDSPAVRAAEKPLVLTTSVSAPLYAEDGSGLYNRLVDEIFRRLDWDYELIWLPAQRSLASTNSGVYAGNLARSVAIEGKFTNMVRVPEQIFEFEFMAYSRDRSIQVLNWGDLKPYVVGIINGWKIVERNVTEVRAVTRVNDYEQLFGLLDKGRIDVAILDRVMGSLQLKQLGLDIRAIEPALVKRPMFLYLHKKHRDLVPEIARVVAEMKQDGSFAAIYDEVLPGFLQR